MAIISGLCHEISANCHTKDICGYHEPVTDVAGTEVRAVGRKVLCVHGRQRVVTEANAVEAAHDLERRDVVGHVEFVDGVGGVEDEVELERELLVPVLLAGHDELLGAHLERVVLLTGAVGENVDLSAESDGPEDGEVTETSQADDGDLLAGAGAEADERRVGFARVSVLPDLVGF